jgi:signal transduction histidine kinase
MIAQILAKKSPDPEQIQNTSERIVKNVDRIDMMIQNLLDFTHFRVGEKLPFNPLHCNLNKIVQDAMEELIVIHGKRFELVANEEINAVADCNAITRIIENLGTNAVKYGSKSTPITLKLERSNNYLNISMHNMGNPIEPKDLETIFEPFKRTESAQQGSQKGWGIGLPLVKGLAEAHGGHAKVESTEKGTTFTISLPVT